MCLRVVENRERIIAGQANVKIIHVYATNVMNEMNHSDTTNPINRVSWEFHFSSRWILELEPPNMAHIVTPNNEFYISLLSNNSIDRYKQNTLSSFTNHLASPIDLSTDDWYVGIVEIECNLTNTTNNFIELGCVYTDFIKPQFIGNTLTRYLRILPMKNSTRLLQSFQFKPIQYCSVDQKYIESISILIANLEGKNIEFKDSKVPTYLLLHFKRM